MHARLSAAGFATATLPPSSTHAWLMQEAPGKPSVDPAGHVQQSCKPWRSGIPLLTRTHTHEPTPTHTHTRAPFPEVTQPGDQVFNNKQHKQHKQRRHALSHACVGPAAQQTSTHPFMHADPANTAAAQDARAQPNMCVARVLSPCSSCGLAPQHARLHPALDRTAQRLNARAGGQLCALASATPCRAGLASKT